MAERRDGLPSVFADYAMRTGMGPNEDLDRTLTVAVTQYRCRSCRERFLWHHIVEYAPSNEEPRCPRCSGTSAVRLDPSRERDDDTVKSQGEAGA